MTQKLVHIYIFFFFVKQLIAVVLKIIFICVSWVTLRI